jgi:hypothetical protein
VGNLNLLEAFARFGGKPSSRLHSLSAMAADGTEMIMGCTASRFGHPSRGVLRYEDRISRESSHPNEMQSLGQHLTLARDGNLPIRMIVITEKAEDTGKVSREIHVRADLVGKVTSFDGDHFIVDFVRTIEPAIATTSRSRRA